MLNSMSNGLRASNGEAPDTKVLHKPQLLLKLRSCGIATGLNTLYARASSCAMHSALTSWQPQPMPEVPQ